MNADHMTVNLEHTPMILWFKDGHPTLSPVSIDKLLSIVPEAAETPRRPLVRYVVTKKSPPKKINPTLLVVYHALKSHPASGLSTPDLVARLGSKMAVNTIRWATQVLRQRGLVKTVA